MPAPQASAMQQLARLKFASFSIRVPTEWKPNAGGNSSDQFQTAFKSGELSTAPDTGTQPPLFLPQTMNKYHTDVQKKLNQQFGSFIDGICSAICSA